VDRRRQVKGSGEHDVTPFVVVGVDGSISSMAAASWAAEEARRRHHRLRVLAAYVVPIVGHPDDDHRPEFADAIRTSRHETLERAEAELARTHPDLEIATSLVESDARTALVEASTGASLTVVGSRGSGRLVEIQLGSVAMHVAAHARSPVAVVPHGLPLPDRPVLVGVDGSPAGHAALGHALDQAATRGVELVAIRACEALSLRPSAHRPVPGVDSQAEHAVLAEQLAGWRGKYPDVPVREVICRGQPAAALLRYGQQWPDEQSPQLIVVGSSGQVRFTGGQLGSTSGALIAHATCPIIVVHAPVAA
jgi:nucleotide-binding universal stress UspA family protein